MNLKTSIVYSGLMSGPMSMGRVGEALVRHWLSRPAYDVSFLPWDVDGCDDLWPPEIRSRVLKEERTFDVSVRFCSVHDADWPRIAARHCSWIYYEFATLPGEFVKKLDTNDVVYATSRFTRDVFISSGARKPVEVLGHGFDPAHFRYRERRRPDGKLAFLCVAEHRPRKNLAGLIRAFERAFPNNDDVELRIKGGVHAYASGVDDLMELIRQPERVKFIEAFYANDSGMGALYEEADCFVLPTRGEGFGLPILEAMATGLPVIVTAYGGHLDFCTAENSFLVNVKGMVDCDPNFFPGVQSQWAEPDEDHLVSLLRDVYEHYDKALEVGRKGWESVREDWTWSAQLDKHFP